MLLRCFSLFSDPEDPIAAKDKIQDAALSKFGGTYTRLANWTSSKWPAPGWTKGLRPGMQGADLARTGPEEFGGVVGD
jgi:hypothetical protein